MTNFLLRNIAANSLPDFDSKLVLWIWNPDEIPPHVAISLNGIYFSLTVKGKEIKTTDQLVKSIKRKKSKLVFAELSNNLTIDELNTEFQLFEKAGINNSTCSTPIFQVVKAPETVSKLSELLIFLEETKNLEKYFSVHLKEDFCEIPFYNKEIIQEKINALNNGRKA